ncbi:MAG: transcriptional repressor [Myxococcota bacterium]|nr:transcriptional repressor [Myxococcota bacterium]
MSQNNDIDWARATLAEFMASQGKKQTRQRQAIVEAFFSADGHLSLQDLLNVVQESDPGVGFATVYRTMKMLVEAGVAKERDFGADQALYELVHPNEHHDHLICSVCGLIFEFEDEIIESRQEEIAQGLGLTITGHRHVLYGEPLGSGSGACEVSGCLNRKEGT